MRGGENHFEIIVQTVALETFREMQALCLGNRVCLRSVMENCRALCGRKVSRSMLGRDFALYVEERFGTLC